VNIT
jgi:hypothetical protein